MNCKKKIRDRWLALTINKKIGFFIGIVFLIIFLSVLFDGWVVNFSLNDFKVILDDNARTIKYMNAIETESSYFSMYIKAPSKEKKKELEVICNRTKEAIKNLPDDYHDLGEYRYAKTWSIRNSYEVYEKKRDLVLEMDEESSNYIKELYRVYDMQYFLQSYARTLMSYTLEEGTASYIEKIPYLKAVPFMLVFFGMILFIGIIRLAQVMNKTLISPIMKLVELSKRIAANDFSVEDVRVENQDEMGELVDAFNKMKKEMRQQISALEEKREMASLLHKEELQRLDIERRLEVTNFELLKNQMQPHFFFNTLNVIGGMANLEEAKVTEKMIKAMSSLFRYNLKTPETEILLGQELQVIRDYMYLQEIRFGNRISYEIDCKVDELVVKIPTFSFQPLIENAIIHGISKKEEGGKIYIRIRLQGSILCISIMDTGVGMTQEKLMQIRNAFKEGSTAHVGIGLGNIYKRIHTMYPKGEMEIFSKENSGTVIRIKIPQVE